MGIPENVLKVKETVSHACFKINQDPGNIAIVAVSKGRSSEQIKEVIDSGLTDIGENRTQEAILKHNAIRITQCAQRIKWHMVGHLQTNKAKEAVKLFDLIHSVDSVRLAQEIDKEASKINKTQDVLIQVNASGETSKFGLSPAEAMGAVKEIAKFKNVLIRGLMTIAPLVNDQEKARIYFRRLRELMESINAQRITPDALRELSMGMSDDFEVAIEEGATMVRIGRAIFEDK